MSEIGGPKVGLMNKAALPALLDRLAVCPACGAPSITSSVVGRPKAHNTRFCACSLMLLAQEGWKRGGRNSFLLGY